MSTVDVAALAAHRQAIEAACLEGLIDTPHGYKYRPSKGADAVIAALAPLLDQDARVWEGLARRAIAAVGTGGHSHWRSGGSGGHCSACAAQSEAQDALRAEADRLTPDEVTP